MKPIGRYTVGIIISVARILAGGYLISQASREYVDTVTVIDPAVYSSGPEEQMIAGTHSAETETRIVTETNYFYLAAGIGMIFFTGAYWLYRFVNAGRQNSGRRRERF